jgi:hypothetical protein
VRSLLSLSLIIIQFRYLFRITQKGIPKDKLNIVFERGASFGKKNGTGLGLYHAKRTIEKYNGTIELESKLGIGTNILITLPQKIPDDFQADKTIVLIDNDPLVRTTWELSARKKNIHLKTFESTGQFLQAGLNKNIKLYVDSDLGEISSGEDFAKIAFESGYEDVSMATGVQPEEFTEYPFLKSVIGKKPPWLHINE